jgi:hypothetical protein
VLSIHKHTDLVWQNDGQAKNYLIVKHRRNINTFGTLKKYFCNVYKHLKLILNY